MYTSVTHRLGHGFTSSEVPHSPSSEVSPGVGSTVKIHKPNLVMSTAINTPSVNFDEPLISVADPPTWKFMAIPGFLQIPVSRSTLHHSDLTSMNTMVGYTTSFIPHSNLLLQSLKSLSLIELDSSKPRINTPSISVVTSDHTLLSKHGNSADNHDSHPIPLVNYTILEKRMRYPDITRQSSQTNHFTASTYPVLRFNQSSGRGSNVLKVVRQ